MKKPRCSDPLLPRNDEFMPFARRVHTISGKIRKSLCTKSQCTVRNYASPSCRRVLADLEFCSRSGEMESADVTDRLLKTALSGRQAIAEVLEVNRTQILVLALIACANSRPA
jgi:hypothetical protein